MSRASDVATNEFLRLGKAPAKRDARNLQLKALLRRKVRLPKEYDFDLKHRAVPTPMFANDVHGCCVIAGRAHQTIRFELVEQKRIIRVTEKDVLDEYFEQSNGEDNGLITLDSLRLWRKQGWIAARKRYMIRAFSEVDRRSVDEVKTAIFMNLGVGIGLRLPKSAEHELTAGKAWRRTTGRDSGPDTWGGHYVYVCGYTTLGPVCVTWGRKQQMSWAFFRKYCDEAYAIIDAINTSQKRSMLNEKVLDAFLQTVSKPQRGGRPRKAPAKRPRTTPDARGSTAPAKRTAKRATKRTSNRAR